jgi:hypothetical protein
MSSSGFCFHPRGKSLKVVVMPFLSLDPEFARSKFEN